MTDLDELARRFTARTLPKAEWTHEAHLIVGLGHVARYGLDEGLVRLRTGIRRLNDRHGTPNTSSSGYHETITRAYVTLLAAFLARCPNELSLDSKAARMLASGLADRHVLFRYYSRDRLLSTEARATWVEPDLAPLDRDATASTAVSRADLVRQLGELGVSAGAVLIVRTAFSRIRPVEGGPSGFIQALRDALGPDGTLVMPSFADDDDHVFDARTSPWRGFASRRRPSCIRAAPAPSATPRGPACRDKDVTADVEQGR